MLSVEEVLKIGKFTYINIVTFNLKKLYAWYILLYTRLYIRNDILQVPCKEHIK